MEPVLVAMAVTATSEDDCFSLITNKVPYNLTASDVTIVTSGNRRIPAHSGILASASPVLMNIMKKPVKRYRGYGAKRAIKILGVPCDAVSVFIRFLYSSSVTEDELENYGIHLLALSHVYMVTTLKQRCSKGIVERLTAENVVDVLQMARFCDAPDVCLKSMRLIQSQFKTVEQTEGWKFLQEHDPVLELDILQFIDDTESRKKRRRRHKKEQNLYMQLSEAMECIEHICTQGCTLVGPTNIEDDDNNSTTVPFGEKSNPCKAFSTCYGLQLSIRHFAVCKKRSNEKGCLRCKRMLQLLRLHSSICDQPESCRVPLCRHFKKRVEQDKKMGEDTKWKLLVRTEAALDGSKGSGCFRPPLNYQLYRPLRNVLYLIARVVKLCLNAKEICFWPNNYKGRLWVRRVVSAKAMSSLCQSKKNKCDGEAEGLVMNRT